MANREFLALTVVYVLFAFAGGMDFVTILCNNRMGASHMADAYSAVQLLCALFSIPAGYLAGALYAYRSGLAILGSGVALSFPISVFRFRVAGSYAKRCADRNVCATFWRPGRSRSNITGGLPPSSVRVQAAPR